MPRGPKGERRPADMIGNAVHISGSRMTVLDLLPSICCGGGHSVRYGLDDADGIAGLKQVLDKYEEILKLLQ